MEGGFFQEIISAMKERELSKKQVQLLKNALTKKYGLVRVPTNIEILLHAGKRDGLNLITKPVRLMSGVAPLALMTAPFACPHGKCLYCPGGPGSAFGDVPQSYTGNEPSTMRAIRNNYDPYLITFNRLEQFIALGHLPQKMEAIIQGGTFPAVPKEYQESFLKYMFKAMNDFGKMFYTADGVNLEAYKEFFELPGDIHNAERVKRIQEKVLALKGECTLEEEQLKNETAKIRCVALCIETKPDWCFEPHINEMLRQGTTRVELGVQCLDDSILKFTHRGHDLKDTIKATQLMKDSFLKTGYHIMPGQPGSTKEKDIDMFRELFENPAYKPDSLKIYPTLVMRGTGLWGLWKTGKFKPLSVEESAEIIALGKQYIPKWCRVMRVQRDIPSTLVTAGAKKTNLRQYVEDYKKKHGIKCKCIRCREPRDREIDYSNVKILREDYESSQGHEVFLSVEDVKNDILVGFCRLRIPHKHFRPEITEKSAGIRELHVYGTAVAIGKEHGEHAQHRGWGKKLMAESEKIAKEEFGIKKMLVISGIGAREYYYKLGYKKDGIYVSKEL